MDGVVAARRRILDELVVALHVGGLGSPGGGRDEQQPELSPSPIPDGFSAQSFGTSITPSSSKIVTVVAQTVAEEQWAAVASKTGQDAVQFTVEVSSDSAAVSPHI